jgi:two-component system, NtrC family, sensor kinase
VKLSVKVIFYIFLTCVVPLLLLAWTTRDLSQRALEALVGESQVWRAEASALALARQLQEDQRILSVQLSTFRLEAATDEARSSFLVATYRLLPDLCMVALLDRDGELLVEPVTGGGEGRRLLPADTIAEVLRTVPLPEGQSIALGQPIRLTDGVVVPVSMRSPFDGGFVLAGALSLDQTRAALERAAGKRRELALVDSRGGLLLSAGPAGLVDLSSITGLQSQDLVVYRYTTTEGKPVIAAMAPAGEQWRIIVAEPGDVVTAATVRLEQQAWYMLAVAVFAAIAMGGMLTRSLTDPVLRLRKTAREVGSGNLQARVVVEGRDELAELGCSFNEMASSLERSAAELERKNREIQAFNIELQQRVDERTRELREAQAQLVQTAQLVAVGELAAGVAHELNNPLAGLLGLIQIAIQAPDPALLRAAEEQALRCREILATLSRFTSTTGGPGVAVVDLDELLREAVGLTGPTFAQHGVEVHLTGQGSLKIRGESALLFRALFQVLNAIRGLVAPRAQLGIDAQRVGDQAQICFQLSEATGNLDHWQAAGLGFWAARQVLSVHGGTFSDAAGATMGGSRLWTLSFPVCTDAR